MKNSEIFTEALFSETCYQTLVAPPSHFDLVCSNLWMPSVTARDSLSLSYLRGKKSTGKSKGKTFLLISRLNEREWSFVWKGYELQYMGTIAVQRRSFDTLFYF